MSIEIVDPDAIERDPKPASPPAAEKEARSDPHQGPKRLAAIDAKLDKSLAGLAQQIDRLHSLNARLFGAAKAASENQQAGANGRDNGVVRDLDDKTARLEALLEKLDEEVRAIDSLA